MSVRSRSSALCRVCCQCCPHLSTHHHIQMLCFASVLFLFPHGLQSKLARQTVSDGRPFVFAKGTRKYLCPCGSSAVAWQRSCNHSPVPSVLPQYLHQTFNMCSFLAGKSEKSVCWCNKVVTCDLSSLFRVRHIGSNDLLFKYVE